MSRSIAVRLAIAVARIERCIGWPGVAGLAFIVAAELWMAHARQDRASLPTASAGVPVVFAASQPQRSPSLALPPATDIPLLLTRIQRRALDEGLGWPKADYRVSAATDDVPASVDVRAVLKGPYPAFAAS